MARGTNGEGGRQMTVRRPDLRQTRDALAQSSDYDFAGSSGGGDGGLAMRQSWKNNMCRWQISLDVLP
ncbi:hypothetical protein NL676_011781 [Syzygium grande]|nr:hypothetical protein NL676_011781 [Syzygium grande]